VLSRAAFKREVARVNCRCDEQKIFFEGREVGKCCFNVFDAVS
jgi:hypothetical protein